MNEIINKPFFWVRKTWNQLKRVAPIPVEYIRPAKVAHPGAVHGEKITAKRAMKTNRTRHTEKLTNHERVIKGRAARMGITVMEYIASFCE